MTVSYQHAPAYIGDKNTCGDEIGTPGEIGYTVRTWRPRADGLCYSADAIPVRPIQ